MRFQHEFDKYKNVGGRVYLSTLYSKSLIYNWGG